MDIQINSKSTMTVQDGIFDAVAVFWATFVIQSSPFIDLTS